MLRDFKDFLFRGNLIELAVAVVIGLAFAAVVTAFVEGLITPLIAAIFGQPDFSDLTFTINDSVFRYGDFLNALITFVLVAAAIYFLVVVSDEETGPWQAADAHVPGLPERNPRRRAPLRLLW
jgi:large conductance mechanosensitive channel